MVRITAIDSITGMTKRMNHRNLLVATVVALATNVVLPAHADDDKYRARETTLDLFGSGSVGQETINHITDERVRDDLRIGAGAGLNYFVTRNLGFGGEAYSENTGHSFLDNASASLIGRFPLGQSGFAPYLYGGGGRQFDPTLLNFLHAGGGLEYRFTQKLGIFLDGRYVFTDETENHGLGRVGLRFAF